MASASTRRQKNDRNVVSTMEQSFWLRVLIAFVYAALMVLIINFGSPSGDTVFSLQRSFATLAVAASSLALVHLFGEISNRNGKLVLALGGLVIQVAIQRLVNFFVLENGFHGDYMLLLAPVALAPMIHSVLLGRQGGAFSVIFASMFGSMLMPEGAAVAYMVACMVSGFVAVMLTRNVRRRGSLLRAGFYVGLASVVMALVFNHINLMSVQTTEGVSSEGLKLVVALAIGMLTGMIVSGILPILESLFQITTGISWLEMSDLNHRLLRKMQLEAPGTYHHSMVVATLAEAAAEEIGANASLCRVAAYFHDIGKIEKPQYFIENQDEINPHDDLTPKMSALVIISHVKDGVDLALKHKLNPAIIDVIREHHGNSLVAFFYHKAQELRLAELQKVEEGKGNAEDVADVLQSSFRYPGPCPRTRESGIISLADAVESASRSLKKPSSKKIQKLVDDIVRARVNDSQLDDSQLSLGDIREVKRSFVKTLSSMMHTRIDYPKEAEANEMAARGKTATSKMHAGNKAPTSKMKPDVKTATAKMDAESKTATTKLQDQGKSKAATAKLQPDNKPADANKLAEKKTPTKKLKS
ncbi:HDIG domain-containing metalloprotein [Persicirhabdus sediminis]|uniref:HDIG domain-containing protein n=1 Tax=Persicirhabdus sediminis TaxID=454144 RepID=A0A8J7MEL5_9BACT|nr:HDIG domain-containing metalloprotein [Persicirhabdus sediminis]MBK1791251.1 HDIG domain-containing protein [Persicirhabdus sediminis]